MNLVVIFGTRPEAIKIGPVVAELRNLGIQPTMLCTGQHTSLLHGTPAESDLAGAETLGLPSTGNVTTWLLHASAVLEEWFRTREPSWVVVQGDTMSAYAGAKAAHQAGWPVAHIEAGLRSGDLNNPWPEEGFRRDIAQLASLHFAPTDRARENLLAEGVSRETIFVTGNPGVSALTTYTSARPFTKPTKTLLFTMHRREWLQSPNHLAILDALQRLDPSFDLLWPVHPAVNLQGAPPLPGNVHLLPPLSYRVTLTLLAQSWGILTDSGGLQEEAVTLGVPCAVLRKTCDRPEGFSPICHRFNPEHLSDALRWITTPRPRMPSHAYGLPDAARLIAMRILEKCTLSTVRSPTPVV